MMMMMKTGPERKRSAEGQITKFEGGICSALLSSSTSIRWTSISPGLRYIENSNISEERTFQDESLNGTLWFDGPVVVE